MVRLLAFQETKYFKSAIFKTYPFLKGIFYGQIYQLSIKLLIGCLLLSVSNSLLQYTIVVAESCFHTSNLSYNDIGAVFQTWTGAAFC